ncbi:hypothetical protein [Pseudonocardia parietis]|uniref:Transcriptional regulator n=1 Tax=Pseudonocardia parietis TaxID=570936 RepID=A0ABS4VPK4_9PSEU|nr:hypothetical protein [Pseudonocardia parietis]MBP2365855.1 hypothetical protein [Pseudonocardia parietis]
MDTVVLPRSILLWDAAEVVDPPAGPCCLRTTAEGDRAVVYRTGPGGGVVALADALADARRRPDGGWWAPVAVHRLRVPVPRTDLLADDLLAPVFRHLRGRRRLPADAARRLLELTGTDQRRPAGRPGDTPTAREGEPVEPGPRFWHSHE